MLYDRVQWVAVKILFIHPHLNVQLICAYLQLLLRKHPTAKYTVLNEFVTKENEEDMEDTLPKDDGTDRARERGTQVGKQRCSERGSHKEVNWRCRHRNKGGSPDLIRDKLPGDKHWLRERIDCFYNKFISMHTVTESIVTC